MEHIRCVVERITYQNEQNGYSVIKCRAKGFQDLVTVVGLMPDVHVGSVLSLGGSWRVDAKYGRQFIMETFEETLPATVYGIEKYLGSGLIKEIGPKYAKKIVNRFGKDTLDIIEETPEELLKVPGIGKSRVESIRKGWTEQKEIKNIMLFLQSHDVTTSHATKIYKTYGNESIKVVEENPYRLADDIWGIGFRTADTIAEKMGFGHERFTRLRSGIMYTLNKLPDYYHIPASDIQVLTPMQRSVIGASNLNQALQEALNPTGAFLRRGGVCYRNNDKVMQIRNNYDKDVFNGDIGIITGVDTEERTITVNFDGRSVEYDSTELDELVLAYASTIHKAQGSEYPIVVMPVMMSHYVMLQRNLIYTGITRAKKILVLVGAKKALAYAVNHVTVDKRNTLLRDRLRELLPPYKTEQRSALKTIGNSPENENEGNVYNLSEIRTDERLVAETAEYGTKKESDRNTGDQQGGC